MTDAALELDGVGKRYSKLEDRAMLLRSLVPFARTKRTEMWALRNISLRIGEGETVGILGRNGAGKSTLLRLLAGVSRPTEGTVRIRGRVAPLISVGVGFHHEMSGRENVYVNGMLLGLTAKEIEERFDDIVAFAELADFIDTPVKFYSSGMYMRLGFSVAAHVEPDVLLVDEILAVGDLSFQFKCHERMRELQRSGTSIVIVSHSMHAIRQLCPRTLLLRRGGIEFDGPTEGAIARHFELLSVNEEDADNEHVTVLSQQLIGGEGVDHHANYDEPVEFRMRLRFNHEVAHPRFLFQVMSEAGLPVSTTPTQAGGQYRVYAAGEEAELRVTFRARFAGGSYRLGVIIGEGEGAVLFRGEGLVLYVAPRGGTFGYTDPIAQLFVDGDDRTQTEVLSLDAPPPRQN